MPDAEQGCGGTTVTVLPTNDDGVEFDRVVEGIAELFVLLCDVALPLHPAATIIAPAMIIRPMGERTTPYRSPGVGVSMTGM